MKRIGVALIVSITSVVVGCTGSEPSGGATGEADLVSTEAAFEYECTTEQMFIQEPTTKVLVSKKHLQFTDEYGEQLGALDPTYHAPAGKQRVRFEGYETGEDCSMKVVADQAVLDGKPTGEVRIQCAGDGFMQEVLSCSQPKAAKLKIVTPDPAPPVDPSTVVPADAKKWSCTTTDGSAFGDKVTMQVADGAISVTDEDFEYTGTRDRDYRPQSGNWIQYDDVEYGGDCSITLVVDAKALDPATRSTQLKVRCAGDDFVQALYRCQAQ